MKKSIITALVNTAEMKHQQPASECQGAETMFETVNFIIVFCW